MPTMQTRMYLTKAFTQSKDYGNPAGVCIDASDLSDDQMLHISKELGFSECAFVTQSDIADFRVRFFSPKEEVGFCGHATVATFHTLVKHGHISTDNGPRTVMQETNIGVLPVKCGTDGKIIMTQKDVKFGAQLDDRKAVASLLGLSEFDLVSNLPVQVVSTGSPKLIIPIVSFQKLKSATPMLKEIIDHGEANNYSGVYVFSKEPYASDSDAAARSFNPNVGINEDPATGIAAGPLGCYIQKHISPEIGQFTIDQGFDMGMNSTLYVDVSGHVQVGGYGASYDERVFNFEDES